MKRTAKYVAFDVHQATTVASVRDDSGRVLARSVLETHRPSIVEFLCGMRGALHVAFEVGTQSQWLHGSGGAARRSGGGLRWATGGLHPSPSARIGLLA